MAAETRALALVGAGVHAREPAWRDEGLALARDCATRTPELKDACFCHGAAGAAHLFHRMAAATGDTVLTEAARTWLHRVLAMRNAEPIAGFPRMYIEREHRVVQPDASLLDGAPGVALVLHAAISDVEPTSDRRLLADFP